MASSVADTFIFRYATNFRSDFQYLMKVTGGWEQHNTGRNVEISISIRLAFKATIFFVEYCNRLRF